MSVARTWSVALVGLEGAVVEVEADLSRQLPDFRIEVDAIAVRRAG
ncbi:MAG: hypothetical protein J0I66_02795 [Microbacterium sp.]|nr:hypothetical protein [Microbacterium sp.]